LTTSRHSGLIVRKAFPQSETTMTTSRISLFSVFAFTIATLAFTVLFGTPPTSEFAMAEGFQTPILALEFAKSPEDLAFLQGEDAAELRAALVHTQALDRYFPIAYAGMAAMLFLGLALRGRWPGWQ
jgi:hypothetical protein